MTNNPAYLLKLGTWEFLIVSTTEICVITRVVNSGDFNFPISEVHNWLCNRILNILKIIG